MSPLADRRHLVAIAAGLLGVLVVGGAAYWWETRTVTVGILHSDAGSLANSEIPVREATIFGLEELDRVLGHRVRWEVAEGIDADDPESFVRGARELLDKGAVALFGCWTSQSRRKVVRYLEERGGLLYYPVFYEGLESSENVVYLGASANQRILPATRWARLTFGPRFFLVGSDYVFPHAAHQLIRDELQTWRGEVVGEALIPLDSMDVTEAVAAIAASDADVILNTVNGQANKPLFDELRNAGSTTPVLSFAVGEVEAEAIGLSAVGHHVAWSYLESLPMPENRDFLGRWREDHPGEPVSKPIVGGYTAVQLWTAAAEHAGTFDWERVRDATGQLAISAPGGVEYVDKETLHAWRTFRVARIGDDGEFEIVWEEPAPIPADPWPGDRTEAEWKELIPGL